MSNILKKITSRKFLLALAGTSVGIALAFGVEGSEIKQLSGSVLSIISIVSYIITEGKIDAESVKNNVKSISENTDTTEGAE